MPRKLEILEINSMLYFIMRASYIGIAITNILVLSKVDGYLCPLIGGILGLLFLLFYFKMINIDPDKNIVDNINSTFGNVLGKIINVLVCLFVFTLASILYYDITNFMGSEYLFNTPSMIIALVGVFPLVYLLNKGLNVIAKTSVIIFFISIILYIFSIAGLINQNSFNNLLPFLENGISPLIHGTLSYIAYSVLPIFIMTIIPKSNINMKKGSEKKIILFYLLITLINFSVLCNVISVLGIDLALLYQYPDYHVLRRISIGGFIQRIESLLAVQWIFCIFMLLIYSFYFINTSIKQTFNIKKHEKSVNFIVVILTMTLSLFIFKNNTIANEFFIHIYPTCLFIFFLIVPIILYFIIKKRVRKSNLVSYFLFN